MLRERRRSALSPELLIRVSLIWALVAVLALLNNIAEISGRLYPDPDDIMRLVQVRDLLGEQSWFDMTQYRVDSASGGVVTHWSRLVDLPLAAVIFVLAPVLGQSGAELTALIVVPLLTLFIAMLLTARIAWRLTGEAEASFACIAMALSMPLLFQFGPLRIDHHGWQIVCALVAVNALMARQASTGGWLAGFAIATWLSISIEGAPLAAALLALVGLRWLRNRAGKDWLVHLTRSLFVSSAGLFLITRGMPGLETPCDAIGSAHLAAMGFVALVTTVLAKAEPIPRAGVLAGFLVATGGGLGIVAWGTAQCALSGPLGMDAILRSLWHSQIGEGLPIWHQDLRTAVQITVLPLLGILASIQLTAQSRDWLREWWWDYTILLVAAFIMALLVARAGALASALAAAPLGWQINQWLRQIRHIDRAGKKAAALAAVACALLPTLPVTVLALAMPAHAALVGKPLGSGNTKSSSCRIAQSAKELAVLPAGEIYAPLDIGPRLLLDTPHSVIATGHHRGAEGMRTVIEVAMGDEHSARQILAERGTAYVALCPDLAEPNVYISASPDGFMAQLRDNEAPQWLEPIALEGETSLKVWRVRTD
ncbi:hypothetical protein [Altererythrobacter lutimaris]|uniref:AcrB/AcrD/AcrF family protein n=1 Tax=Altererythrobacter lutimaris TaxID=2743979 RepID=A0A850HEI1_9SPHN|nr:hypothetical protein [Altererythrobacter lutimaris]NVE95278.1 hypothetical protein [Altererythrobacter lutimaris]